MVFRQTSAGSLIRSGRGAPLSMAALIALVSIAGTAASRAEDQPPAPTERPPAAAATNEPRPEGPAATLPALIAEALERNPEIQAARRRVEAKRARIPQAGALPDPMAMTGVMNEGRPIPFQTLGEAGFSEVYVGVSQDIPFPGKRRLREAAAREEAAAEEWALESTRRRVGAEVADAYYELYASHAALAVLDESRIVADQLSGVAASRFGVGQGTQQDVFDAEVELSIIEERRTLLVQRRQTAEAQLALLLNRASPVVVGVTATLARTPLPETVDGLLAQAEELSPLLRERGAMVAQAERRVELARRDRLPDLGVEFVYHNRGRLDPYWTFGGTVTLPIYAGRKQKKAIEEAAAELSAARSTLEAARNEIRYAVRQAYLAARAADRVLRLYDQALLKQSELSLESAVAQYRVGKVDFQTLVAAWRRLLDQRAARHEQLASYEKALARLAVHVPVSGGLLAVLKEN
jgi:cobalt-zinc-cadmium efflux system outer membrane protein